MKQRITPVAAAGDEKLKGTALVKRVAESCALLTVKTRATARRVKLSCQAAFDTLNRDKDSSAENTARKPKFRELLPKAAKYGEIVADPYGRIVEVNLGQEKPRENQSLAFSVLEPLPPGGKTQWKASELNSIEFSLQETKVVQAPKSNRAPNPADRGTPGFGPGSGAWPGRSPFGGNDDFGPFGGAGMGPRFGPQYGPRVGPGGFGADPRNRQQPQQPQQPSTVTTKTHVSIPVREDTTVTVAEPKGTTTVVTRRFTVKTLDSKGKTETPKLEIVTTGKTVLDNELGVPRSVEVRTDVVIGDGKERTVNNVKYSFQLIDGNELARFNQPELLTNADLRETLAELKKTDVADRFVALNRLAKAQPNDDQSEQVMKSLEPLVANIDNTLVPPLFSIIKAWGGENAIGIWTKLISHSSANIRTQAFQVLPIIQDGRLVDALAETCVANADVRRPAFEFLAKIGELAEPAAIRLLSHEERPIRTEAAKLLEKIGTESCLPLARKIAVGEDLADARLARSLVTTVCKRLRLAAPDFPPLVAKSTAVSPAPPAADPPSKPATPETASAKTKSIPAKATPTTSKTAAARNQSTLDRLVADLKGSDHFKRKDAAAALAAVIPSDGPGREVAAALEELVDDGDGFVRREAIKALAIWGDKDTVPYLVAAASHQDEFTQREAAKALALFNDPRAAKTLAEQLPNFHTRGDATDGLVLMGSIAESAVIPLLGHADRGTRETACDILKAIGTAKSLGDVDAAIQMDESVRDRARQAAVQIRKRLGEPDPNGPTAKALERWIADVKASDDGVRQRADSQAREVRPAPSPARRAGETCSLGRF